MVRAGRSGHGVRLVLRKQIPAGGGLGGGSADAAAALLAVRQLLDVDVDDDGVLAIAAEVGSDVPFCVRGGAAWMRGRGEIIEPVDAAARARRSSSRSRRSGCRPPTSTAAWDELGGPRSTRVGARAAPRRARSSPSWSTTSSRRPRRVEPRLRGVPRRARGRRPGAPALLAGSGSAYVVPVADARDAARRWSTR